MPIIYLSPSTQEYNNFINGGTEEYYMNLIADDMIPYLRASGIRYVRNTPDMTAASSIRQSNEGNFDLHLALHSNAAPENLAGQLRGPDVYYYPGSLRGERAATIIADNLKTIYPDPELVTVLPTTRLGEVSKTRAPGVLIEFAYHDNLEDATWIKNNIRNIARNVVYSLTEYFGIPFVQPQPERTGTVNTTSGNLNIRSRPNTGSEILTTAPNGAPITILGDAGNGWYVVQYRNTVGYASSNYISG